MNSESKSMWFRTLEVEGRRRGREREREKRYEGRIEEERRRRKKSRLKREADDITPCGTHDNC